MALKRYEKYPNRWSPATPEQPQGAFKNRTTSVSKDGSYIEKDWANDWSGFFGAALGKAGIVPNGEVDTALSSQYYEAFRTFFYNPENKPDPVDIGAADRSHGHQIANVSGLQSALDSKSANGHKHNISDVISLQANLDSKYPSTTTDFSGDCDAIVNAGHYSISLSAENWVSTGSGGSMLVMQHGVYITQIAALGSNGALYARNKSGGNWSKWFRIYNESFKPSPTDIEAANAVHKHGISDVNSLQSSLDSKLNLSGGTITGGLASTLTSGQFAGAPAFDTDLNSLHSAKQSSFSYSGTVKRSAKNVFPCTSDANGVLTVNTYQGEYACQIGFSSNGSIYTRSMSGSAWSEWRRFYDTKNKPSAADVGAYTKAESDALMIGINQTAKNLKDSRKLNTTYTNSTGKPIYVSVVSASTTSTNFFELRVDDVTMDAFGLDASPAKNFALKSIVPVGSTYRVYAQIEVPISSWSEIN